MMNYFILLTLIFSQTSLAKAPLVGETGAMTSAVGLVDSIGGVITNAVIPGTTCTEIQIPLGRDVVNKQSPLPVITCVPNSTSLTVPTGEDYSQFIADNKIEFHPNQSAITGTRDWRLFVHEFKKFLPALMQEMVSRGGKIRVMIGNGVSEDRQWQVDKLRAVAVAQTYWDWYYHPRTTAAQKVGYNVPIPPAQIAAGWKKTSEGERQWDVVSGAGGLFSDPTAVVPTRIVLNRMYISAHREENGTLSFNRQQGASNLFLHEHGHAMDGLYGSHSISRSDEWRELMDDPQVKAYLPRIFSNYECDRDEEGFAEAFAYYHSCEASRKQMEEQAPALAEYFRTFDVQKLRSLNKTP